METLMIWSLLSFLLYFFGSCGYLVIDVLGILSMLDTFTSYIAYIVLAGVFVVEGVLYMIDWCHYGCCGTGARKSTCCYVLKLLASIFHNVGSIAYLLGAIFGGNTAQQQQNFLTTPQIYICNIVGMVSLVIEAVLSLFSWMFQPPDGGRCHCSCGVALWAHLFNLLGGLLYLAASILAPVLAVVYATTKSYISIQQTYIRTLQIAGDGVYLIDSLLFLVLWIRERNKLKNNKDQTPLGPDSRTIRFHR